MLSSTGTLWIYISKKTEDGDTPLIVDLSEVLKLERQYSSENTPAMERRGLLIRNVIPDHFRNQISVLEPIFSDAGVFLRCRRFRWRLEKGRITVSQDLCSADVAEREERLVYRSPFLAQG
jgi:hypothetical protein